MCIDDWSNKSVKEYFQYAVVKRSKNIQLILYIDYGTKLNLWLLKESIMPVLKKEGYFMENHTEPVMVVETAVVGFFSKLHSKGIYREHFQDELNCKLKTFFKDNKTDVMKRVNKIHPLRNWTGDSLPECQLVTVYPQWQERNRKYESGQAVGISVPAMH